jgi:hypothetical protein
MIATLAYAWAYGSSRQRCALAMALAAWSGQMRLGELLPATLASLDRSRLPTRERWGISTRCTLASHVRLPWTKTTKYAGAYVYLLHQMDPFDATSAITRHLQASRLPQEALLCEYVDETHNQRNILDKQTFLSMCNELWHAQGITRITGHSFRIGGTTALLRSGVNPDIVKKMGRWSSDAYLRYWRNTEELFEAHAARVSWVDFAI